jgi:sporulation protein YlmC with PRC-barrel domain
VNTRSSTETELIAVDDALPTIQWTKNFMAEQGYVLETEIREDNKSTVLLMKNGKLSSGKRTKHFDIRYFYVKDLIDRGIIKLSHCISENMLADFFTKPLQGKRFQFLRDLILNIKSAAVHRSVLVNNNTEDALLQSKFKTESNRPNPLHTVEREREGVEKKTENDLREKIKIELICEEELNVERKHGNFEVNEIIITILSVNSVS